MQIITVTVNAPDGVDAAAFVAALADRARLVSVQVGTEPYTVERPLYASPGAINFVSAETVPDPEPVTTTTDDGSHAAWVG